jgi:hypothetical protein
VVGGHGNYGDSYDRSKQALQKFLLEVTPEIRKHSVREQRDRAVQECNRCGEARISGHSQVGTGERAQHEVEYEGATVERHHTVD